MTKRKQRSPVLMGGYGPRILIFVQFWQYVPEGLKRHNDFRWNDKSEYLEMLVEERIKNYEEID